MMASLKVTFLHTVNNFAVVGLLISPLVVSYWRGTWGLMDQYLLPLDLIHSPWVSTAIGIPLLVLLNLLQYPLHRLVARTNPCVQHVCHILYIYVHGFANVNHWRGVWKLLDVYTGINAISVTVCLTTGIVVNASIRALYNFLAPPIVVATDFISNPFAITTRFRTDSTRCSWRFVLDALFTVAFMGNMVVLFWRGTWEMFDLFLFPNDPKLTALSCLAIGYILYVSQTVLQYPAIRLSKRLKEHFFLQLALQDIFNLVSAVCSVSLWRGVWLTCDLFLVPTDPTSLLGSHLMGIGVLCLVCAGRSVLVTGCVIDGESVGRTGIRLGQYLQLDDLLPRFDPSSPENGERRKMNQIPETQDNADIVAADMVEQTPL